MKFDLNSVKDAGAKFAVSPGSTISLATHALEKEFPFLPGVSNSSDIMNLINLDYKFLVFETFNYYKIKILVFFMNLHLLN